MVWGKDREFHTDVETLKSGVYSPTGISASSHPYLGRFCPGDLPNSAPPIAFGVRAHLLLPLGEPPLGLVAVA